jgi:hypothetical protein
MHYIEQRMNKHPDLEDEDILKMYPEANQEMIDGFRKNNKGEANEPSRKSVFSFTKADD